MFCIKASGLLINECIELRNTFEPILDESTIYPIINYSYCWLDSDEKMVGFMSMHPYQYGYYWHDTIVPFTQSNCHHIFAIALKRPQNMRHLFNLFYRVYGLERFIYPCKLTGKPSTETGIKMDRRLGMNPSAIPALWEVIIPSEGRLPLFHAI